MSKRQDRFFRIRPNTNQTEITRKLQDLVSGLPYEAFATDHLCIPSEHLSRMSQRQILLRVKELAQPTFTDDVLIKASFGCASFQGLVVLRHSALYSNRLK